MSDRELHALITGGYTEQEKPYPELTNAQVEAAAKELREFDAPGVNVSWEKQIGEGDRQRYRAAVRRIYKVAMEADQ